MSIEEIRAKADITVDEIHNEIDEREGRIFCMQMSEKPNMNRIYELQKEIHELKGMIEDAK